MAYGYFIFFGSGFFMESLIFAINAVAPIVAMVAIGYVLKKAGMIDRSFAKTANRVVFKVLLPAMLFLNVYKIEGVDNIDLGYVFYALAITFAVFLIALFTSGMITKNGAKRGALIQGIFRSNYALIGIPLAGSLFGTEGTMVAAVLSAFAIPFFNVLAVTSLTVFGKGEKKAGFSEIILGIIKNPLIDGVAAGFAALLIRGFFEDAGIAFRLTDIVPLMKVLEYLSVAATPLALIVLGAEFEFSTVGEMKKEILFGTLMRSVFVPVFGIGTAFIFFRNDFSGAQFAALTALFTTPVAVSSVPMAQEMGGDHVLAGQLVVWTTVASAATVFIASFILKTVGIF